MSTVLFERRQDGYVVVTRCANGAGQGSRLELYACAGADGRDPVLIQDPDEAMRLADQLTFWGLEERENRRQAAGTVRARLEASSGDLVAEVDIPAFKKLPEVLVYGQRIFLILSPSSRLYREVFGFHAQ